MAGGEKDAQIFYNLSLSIRHSISFTLSNACPEPAGLLCSAVLVPITVEDPVQGS